MTPEEAKKLIGITPDTNEDYIDESQITEELKAIYESLTLLCHITVICLSFRYAKAHLRLERSGIPESRVNFIGDSGKKECRNNNFMLNYLI